MSDKNTKLSELIRIGSKVSPRNCHSLYRKIDGATCAIGAAYLAKTGELVPEVHPFENESLVALKACVANPTERVYDPMHPGVAKPLINVIVALNDTYRWSREQIANWLESIGL